VVPIRPAVEASPTSASLWRRLKTAIRPGILLAAVARWRDLDFISTHTTRPMIEFCLQWWAPVLGGFAVIGIVWALCRPSAEFARWFTTVASVLVIGVVCLAAGYTAAPSQERRLTDEQITRIAMRLHENGAGKVTIRSRPKDEEAKRYAVDWQRAFRGALWDAPIVNWELTPAFGKAGIVVVHAPGDRLLDGLGELAAAEGIQLEMSAKANAGDHPAMWIGERLPAGTFSEESPPPLPSATPQSPRSPMGDPPRPLPSPE
jgi:hypothetical protein